jgi:adenosylcobinamide kinase/adenosylcobinamide-phosphate guanylyltransferase
LHKSVFVLGGAASGKSVWAEEHLKSAERPMIYLATGRIFDAEVAARVDLHKNRRDDRWTTIEAPLDLAPALGDATPDQAVLIDCATMWLSNHILDGSNLAMAQDALLTALRGCAAPWIIVSNEVGQGIVPENALARQFREAQGRLNIALAAEAELAVQVIAGLPRILKGSLS